MIKILRKAGFELNPKDDFVNKLFEKIEANDGECPCSNGSEDKHCPCTWYRERDICRCGLYLKVRN